MTMAEQTTISSDMAVSVQLTESDIPEGILSELMASHPTANMVAAVYRHQGANILEKAEAAI